MEIILKADHLERLVRLAKDSLPNESCAFLFGKGETIVEILPARNADASTTTFSVEPSELFRAYELAERKMLKVIGIFHSHPSSPSPSRTDVKFMEINPVVWLIYSTTNNKFGAYIFDDKLQEVRIRTVL